MLLGGHMTSTAHAPERRAFSLIELVMVIGVVMIILGLSLPMLSKSIGRARETRSMSAARQCGIFFQMYTDANKEYYPRGEMHSEFGLSRSSWPNAMRQAGLIERAEAADPDGYEKWRMTNFLQSTTSMVHWRMFEPGATIPNNDLQPTWIRSTDVSFPARKGMLSQRIVGDGRVETTWCCVEGSPKGSVVWSDLSVSDEYWVDLLNPDIPRDQYFTGTPVSSTWFGVRGVDRR